VKRSRKLQPEDKEILPLSLSQRQWNPKVAQHHPSLNQDLQQNTAEVDIYFVCVGAGGIIKTLCLGIINCVYGFKNIFLLYINA